MNKSVLASLTLLILVVILSTDAVGQGRSRQGSQPKYGNQQGMQQRQAQNAKGQAGQGRNARRGRSQSNEGNRLAESENLGLILLREEEKLARDVYTALNAKWGEQVFANISRAESQHMKAVGNLLTKYGIPDPIKTDAAGVFTAPQFQQLYNSLVATGSNSLADALKVGLKIEEMDIADLRVAIKATKNQDIQRVLGNLLRGSQNHLRAFARRLGMLGGTYVATSLSQSDFDQIASSKQQPGNSNGRMGGRSNGRASSSNSRGKGQGGQSNRRGRGGKGRGNVGQ